MFLLDINEDGVCCRDFVQKLENQMKLSLVRLSISTSRIWLSFQRGKPYLTALHKRNYNVS